MKSIEDQHFLIWYVHWVMYNFVLVHSLFTDPSINSSPYHKKHALKWIILKKKKHPQNQRQPSRLCSWRKHSTHKTEKRPIVCLTCRRRQRQQEPQSAWRGACKHSFRFFPPGMIVSLYTAYRWTKTSWPNLRALPKGLRVVHSKWDTVTVCLATQSHTF